MTGEVEISKALRKDEEIRAATVRLIGSENKQVGVIPFNEALDQAKSQGLSLVEVEPAKGDIPAVCKIMDYGKYLYQLRKNSDAARKHQHQPELKEMRFTPRIGDNDLLVKVNNIKKFIGHGDKVKVSVRFRGRRELEHRDQGFDLLKKIEQLTAEFAWVEQPAKFEGRQMMMVIAPHRKGAEKKPTDKADKH